MMETEIRDPSTGQTSPQLASHHKKPGEEQGPTDNLISNSQASRL
jgi:hypothetical protein